MEYNYNKIKKMDVVSVSDGKNLGRVCDAVFHFPENKLKGFFVTGGKGFRLTKSDIFIPVSDLIKIGEDVVLVSAGEKPPKPNQPKRKGEPCPPPCAPCQPNRRDYDEYE